MGLSVVPATNAKTEGFASPGKSGGAGNFLSIMSEELADASAGGAFSRPADSDSCPSKVNTAKDVARPAASDAKGAANSKDAGETARETAPAPVDDAITEDSGPIPLESAKSEEPSTEDSVAAEDETKADPALYALAGALAAKIPLTEEAPQTAAPVETAGARTVAEASSIAVEGEAASADAMVGQSPSVEQSKEAAVDNRTTQAVPSASAQTAPQAAELLETAAAPQNAPESADAQGGIFFDAQTAAFAKEKGEAAPNSQAAPSEGAKSADAGTTQTALPLSDADADADPDADPRANQQANPQAAEEARSTRRAGHKAAGGRAKLEETGWKLWGLAKGIVSEKAAASAAANATANIAKPVPTATAKAAVGVKPGEAKGLVRDEEGMPKVAGKDEAPKAAKPDENASDRAFEATAKNTPVAEAKLPDGNATDADAKLALDAAPVKADAASSDAPAKETAKPNQEVSRADREILRQVQGGVRINFLARGEKAVIQLMPEALGRVQVEITRTSQGLAANFKVETVEAKQALTTQVAELKNGFESRGVNLVSVQVELGSDGSMANGKEAGQRRKGKPQTARDEAVIAAAGEVAAPEGWRPWGFETRA